MCAKRLVEIHHTLDQGVEAGQQLGGDDEERERVCGVQETAADRHLGGAGAIEDRPLGRIALGGGHHHLGLLPRPEQTADGLQTLDAQLAVPAP